MLAARKNRKFAPPSKRIGNCQQLEHTLDRSRCSYTLARSNTMDNAELRARVAQLEAQLNAVKTQRLSCRISASKPSVASVYGLGKFPVSLHYTQWQRLIAFIESGVKPVLAQIEANGDSDKTANMTAAVPAEATA